MPPRFKDLDVRPILKEGGEPFPAIMQAVQSLEPGEGLRLLATFRPTPLLSVMARRGYDAEMNELRDGDWEVLFSPASPITANVSVSLGAEEAAGWPDPLWQLDLTGHEPPVPMEKVLSRIGLMEPGEVLFAVFSDEPVFLMPELDKEGHQWVGKPDASGSCYRMLIRVGGA
ncbi:DUF2249 domain-containing protein [Rhizobium glycinendophyticum]|uniref:DUF2249 domain-containing protein n=1 Tax=Rhizobium glycinendophyticum TaxID=2589807 RepID=A0A504UGL6_9HYPH|nr:DUF2249 domain-containing protein [Rhizobium glycinendophyticum]TPP09935.1 DUF2249 domain-containing protein [Rhizobium glycinendophyticum]